MPSNCAQWWGYGYGPGQHAHVEDAWSGTGPRPAVRADAPRLRAGLPRALRSDRMLRQRLQLCGAYGGEAGYLPGAGPMIDSQPQPTMAPAPAAAQRDDSFTWR